MSPILEQLVRRDCIGDDCDSHSTLSFVLTIVFGLILPLFILACLAFVAWKLWKKHQEEEEKKKQNNGYPQQEQGYPPQYPQQPYQQGGSGTMRKW